MTLETRKSYTITERSAGVVGSALSATGGVGGGGVGAGIGGFGSSDIYIPFAVIPKLACSYKII